MQRCKYLPGLGNLRTRNPHRTGYQIIKVVERKLDIEEERLKEWGGMGDVTEILQ